jgi:SOS-response transcriptional repressor LexA
MKGLTEEQQEVLDAIRNHLQRHRQMPTTDELADVCHLSRGGLFSRLRHLERKGILWVERTRPVKIHLLPRAAPYVTDAYPARIYSPEEAVRAFRTG